MFHLGFARGRIQFCSGFPVTLICFSLGSSGSKTTNHELEKSLLNLKALQYYFQDAFSFPLPAIGELDYQRHLKS